MNLNQRELIFHFIVSKKDCNTRVDFFLLKKLHERNIQLSRNFIQSQLHKIKINNLAVKKKNTRILFKDFITFTLKYPNLDYINPFSPIDLTSYPKIKFLYEDSFILILNKPPNLLCHPTLSSKEPSLLHLIKDKLTIFKEDYLTFLKPFLNFKKFLSYDEFQSFLHPGIVHRLDKDSSGILIIAKTPLAQKRLSLLFKKRKIIKKYIALVKNIPPKIGIWKNPIGRNIKNRKKFSIGNHILHPRKAETRFKRIQIFYNSLNEPFSFVKIHLITGRQHQIRVHFSKNGFPIIGDPLYSKRSYFYENQGLSLFSYFIQFYHPFSKKLLSFKLKKPLFFSRIVTISSNCH